MKLYNIFLAALCAGALFATTTDASAEMQKDKMGNTYQIGTDSTGVKIGETDTESTSGDFRGSNLRSYYWTGSNYWDPTGQKNGSVKLTSDKQKAGSNWFPYSTSDESFDSIPIGTVVGMGSGLSDPASMGYLLCNGKTFKATDYPVLAKKLQVCANCGNPLRRTPNGVVYKVGDNGTRKTDADKNPGYLDGSFTSDTSGGLTSSPYCSVCKRKVSWKYCYNDNSSPRDSNNIKLPDLQGKFLRGLNQGNGFNSTAGVGEYYDKNNKKQYRNVYSNNGVKGSALKDPTTGEDTHKSAKMGVTQESAVSATAITSSFAKNGSITFPTMIPVDVDTGNSAAKYYTIDSGDGITATVKAEGAQYITANYLTTAGKVFNAISNPFSLIPGFWDKTVTYSTGTSVKYELNADIGNVNDGSGEAARPLNKAIYYYVKAK